MCAKVTKIIENGVAYLPADPRVTVISGHSAQPARTPARQKPGLAERKGAANTKRASGLQVSFQPDGTLVIEASAGFSVQASSDSPSFVMEVGVIKLALVPKRD